VVVVVVAAMMVVEVMMVLGLVALRCAALRLGVSWRARER
jgi:hypothetical protein